MKHRLLLITVMLIILSALPAQAHRMRVFAYESDGEIISEAKFGSGRPAKGVDIRVEGADGQLLITGVTDDQGISRLPLPAMAKEKGSDLTIIADAGEGHRGSWLLTADDYQGKNRGHVPDSPADGAAAPGLPGKTQTAAENKKQPVLDYADIEEIVQKSVAAELAPVKRMLAAEQQRSITLQDIFGGIGYIIGLAGIAAYFQTKRKGDNR